MPAFETDDLSQAELLCYQPAHELCRSYRAHDLVETITNIIIIMLIIVVIGIFLWVNTKGWDVPRRSQKKRWESDVEGLACIYRDTEGEEGYKHGDGSGHGDGDLGLDAVEGFVQEIRKLAVEGKVKWEAYEEVERVRREQGREGRRGSRGGDCKDVLINKTTSGECEEK